VIKKNIGVGLPVETIDERIKKRLLDFDKELEEDHELLELLNAKSKG
jgi:hypothetical protein